MCLTWTSVYHDELGKVNTLTSLDMPAKPAPVMNLSKIDFAALAAKFKVSRHKNTGLDVLNA